MYITIPSYTLFNYFSYACIPCQIYTMSTQIHDESTSYSEMRWCLGRSLSIKLQSDLPNHGNGQLPGCFLHYHHKT